MEDLSLSKKSKYSQIEDLMNALILFAQKMLQEHGEFYPFAATMSVSGEVGLLAAYTGEEKPKSLDVISDLEEAVKIAADNKEIVGAGVCSDVRIKSESGELTDAVRIELEHADEGSITILLPYTKSADSVEYGEITAQEKPKVWLQ